MDPVTGDMENSYDNVEVKHIDILDDEGNILTTIQSTEWFAEIAYPGQWVVSEGWLQFKAAEEIAAIASRKVEVNAAINAWRLRVNQKSFPFDGKFIACDALSRSDLDGTAIRIALFGEYEPGFTRQWKCVDDTYIPLPEIEDFRDMYDAMVAQGNSNFSKAQQLKQRLAQATTLQAVEAILGELND